MADVFQSIADAMASFLSMPSVTCDSITGCGPQGALLGFIVIIALIVTLVWVIGRDPLVVGIAAGIGFIFSIAVKWIPMWAGLVLVLILLVMWQRPFGGVPERGI